MLKIRLQRTGRKKRPFYRVVVAEHSAPIKGRYVAQVGTYNPLVKPWSFEVDTDKIAEWIKKGAKPTNTVARLLKSEGFKDVDQYIVEMHDRKVKNPSEEPEAPAEAAPVAPEASSEDKSAEGGEAPAEESAPAAEEVPKEEPTSPTEDKPADESAEEVKEEPAEESEESPVEEAPQEEVAPAEEPASEEEKAEESADDQGGEAEPEQELAAEAEEPAPEATTPADAEEEQEK